MLLIDILAVIGTAAFAISGALTGIKSKLDLFGVVILAIITASGGGIIRDVILGREWPVLFTDGKYLITIVASSLITCLVAYTAFYILNKIMYLVMVFDAIGLGVFTALSAYKCLQVGMPPIGIIFVAVLTGIGGGIMRDILANDVPLVLKSEIYALAAVLGAACFIVLYDMLDLTLNLYLCTTVVFVIRIISVYFNINLPVVVIRSEKKEKRRLKN